MKLFFLFLLAFVAAQNTFAQRTIDEFIQLQSKPKLYAVQKTTQPIQIDGKADELAWERVEFRNDFYDIEGNIKKKPLYDTKIKMLWDDQNLYIYAQLEEPHIWGDIDKHDAIIYHNNDFEVFIKPYENQSSYFEIEVNTLNTILDLLMTKPYRFGGEAKLHWDVKGLQTAVYTEGTNNNPDDIDKYWAVEMAIPFRALQNFGRKSTPSVGDYWRINFSRVQWEHEIIDGKYSRKQVNGKLLAENNWVWDAIGIVDMHYPERWSYLLFADQELQNLDYPTSYAIEKFTWNIFYLEKLFYRKHKKYSNSINQLQEIHGLLDKELKNYQYELITNKNQTFYYVEIRDIKNNISTRIDSEGNYSIKYD